MKLNLKTIFNQRGQVLYLGLLFLIFSSAIFIHFIFRQQKNLEEIKDRSKIFLCQKEYISLTEHLIKNVEILNLGIKSQAALQIISIFFPGINLTSLSTIEIKKMIQLQQKIELISFMKNISILKSNKCSFDHSIYKTPYRISAMDFERNTSGETIIRNVKWSVTIFGKHTKLLANLIIKQKFPLNLQREVFELGMSKVMPSWN